jgi:hypothetical protein
MTALDSEDGDVVEVAVRADRRDPQHFFLRHA